MGKKLTIAVDVDDVLAQHYEALVDFYNQRYDAQLTFDDYISDHWSDVWNLSQEETQERAEVFAASNLHETFLLKDFAQEAIQKLEKQYNLVVITARRKQNVDVTHQWLAKHFPNTFGHVRFLPIWDTNTTETKASIAHELDASFLIDDSLKHCTLAAEAGMKAILFGDYPWNQAETLPFGVTRCKDWMAVLEYFDGLS